MKSETNHYLDALRKLNPCADFMQWAEGYDDPQRMWDQCERGDWMLWLCDRMAGNSGSVERKNVVMVACACARLSLKYVNKSEYRPLKAIETAEQWARGEPGVTIENVRAAAAAAYTASAAYAVAYAYAASAAASSASYAAYATSYAAAAAAAYAASAAAADAAARKITLRNCADIVRKYYPKCPLLHCSPIIK